MLSLLHLFSDTRVLHKINYLASEKQQQQLHWLNCELFMFMVGKNTDHSERKKSLESIIFFIIHIGTCPASFKIVRHLLKFLNII